MIKYIPNILTSIRIISIPFIVTFFTLDRIDLTIIIAIFTSITDYFDGYIARKFNVQSEFGAKLDAVSDKFFAIGLLITLSIKFPILLISLFLEIIISIINLYLHFKTKVTKSLLIGKIKTWSLFLNVIIGFISCFNNNFILIMNIVLIITTILQITSILCYIITGYKRKEAV